MHSRTTPETLWSLLVILSAFLLLLLLLLLLRVQVLWGKFRSRLAWRKTLLLKGVGGGGGSWLAG